MQAQLVRTGSMSALAIWRQLRARDPAQRFAGAECTYVYSFPHVVSCYLVLLRHERSSLSLRCVCGRMLVVQAVLPDPQLHLW